MDRVGGVFRLHLRVGVAICIVTNREYEDPKTPVPLDAFRDS